MGNFTYLTNDQNLFATAGITVSSEDTYYPKENAQILPVSKPFRFAGKDSENIQIDFGSAVVIDCICLVAHNLTAAATLTINAGAVANPDGSTYQTTITWRERDAFKLLAAAQTYRYWKIILADVGNAESFIQLGYVLMGDSTTWSFNFTYDWHWIDDYQNLEQETEFGTIHVAELFSRTKLQLEFRNISSANSASVRVVYRTLKRSVTPLLLIPDADVNDGFFGRFSNMLDRTIGLYHSLNLEFIEESRGRSIGI